MALSPHQKHVRTTYYEIGIVIVGMFLVYALGSRALDTGSYWEYLFTILMVIISVKVLFRVMKRHYDSHT
ncbi:MAG: hypothetical protein NVSMB46_00710 [Candidatus Saccharimonadales bacterium]